MKLANPETPRTGPGPVRRCPISDCGAKLGWRAHHCSPICHDAAFLGRTRTEQLHIEAERMPWFAPITTTCEGLVILTLSQIFHRHRH